MVGTERYASPRSLQWMIHQKSDRPATGVHGLFLSSFTIDSSAIQRAVQKRSKIPQRLTAVTEAIAFCEFPGHEEDLQNHSG